MVGVEVSQQRAVPRECVESWGARLCACQVYIPIRAVCADVTPAPILDPVHQTEVRHVWLCGALLAACRHSDDLQVSNTYIS